MNILSDREPPIYGKIASPKRPKSEMKKTEIGWIPKDWEIGSYGEIFDFLPTATYSRKDLNDTGEILYIHYGDIHTKWNSFLDFEENDLPRIDKSKLRHYSLLIEGDLVIVDASEDYSGIGKSIEVKNLKNKKAITGLHTFLLRDKKKVFADGYRGYIHLVESTKSQFEKLATGLKVYGVTKGNLKTVLLPIPPLPEQKAIAQVLSEMDELITATDTLLQKKQAIKQGAMQQLLTGKKRLEGFEGEGYIW